MPPEHEADTTRGFDLLEAEYHDIIPNYEHARQGRREPTYLSKAEWAVAGAWLEKTVVDRGLTSRQVLVGIRYEGGTGRLRAIFKGEQLPTPDTLRSICDITGAPYLEAVAQYGYYREFIALLDRLVCLGEQWLEDDDARGGTLGSDGKPPSRLQSLLYTGVLHWNGRPLMNTSTPPSMFLGRYTVASWDEPEHAVERHTYPPIDVIPGSTTTLVLNPSIKRETLLAPPQRHVAVLPKPIALAIMFAILTFQRRGDVYKDEALDYRQRLYAPADALVTLAEQHSASRTVGRPKLPHPLLRRTQEALSDRILSFEERRVVAAESAVSWARDLCRPFTAFAQFAAFEELGEAGSSVSTATLYRVSPQLYRTQFPALESLTVSN